jgi:hypothetical protein
MLIPSSSSVHSLDQDEEDDHQQHSKRRTPFGRMDASSDEDESDEERDRTHRDSSQKSVIKSV